MAGRHPEIDATYQKALATLKAGGAVLVEVPAPSTTAIAAAEELVLRSEFKAGVNAYLASTSPAKVKTRTLADLIAFNEAHADREMPLFGQETFKTAQAAPGLDDPTYLKARDDRSEERRVGKECRS